MPRRRFRIVSSPFLSCAAEIRRSWSSSRRPYSPQTIVVPRVLPPVGTRGRPLRSFLFAPARGRSQFWAGVVVVKSRMGSCWVVVGWFARWERILGRHFVQTVAGLMARDGAVKDGKSVRILGGGMAVVVGRELMLGFRVDDKMELEAGDLARVRSVRPWRGVESFNQASFLGHDLTSRLRVSSFVLVVETRGQ